MVLYDHGAGTRTTAQSAYADLDVEWRAGTTKAADSQALALKWAFLNGEYATDYPATAYNYSTNTDDTAFQPYVASISVRENRRSLTSGTNAEWINPYYHTTNDVEGSYTRDDDVDGVRDDIELGFNAVQSTVGLVAELAGARIATSSNKAPVANAQIGEYGRGRGQGHHPDRLRRRQRPADVPAWSRNPGSRRPERHRPQPHLHASRQLQRRRQLQLHGSTTARSPHRRLRSASPSRRSMTPPVANPADADDAL